MDQNKKLIQETAYYPYGLPINSLSSKSTFNYLYTGKEFLDTLNINWYDHHARYFDPEVARWWSVDPRIVSASPYMAMYNTPNMAVDPDGEFAIFAAIFAKTAFDWAVGVANNIITNGMSLKNAVANTPISIGMSVNSAGQLSNPVYEQHKILKGVGLAATNLNMQIANYSGIDPPVDDQWNGSAVGHIKKAVILPTRNGKSGPWSEEAADKKISNIFIANMTFTTVNGTVKNGYRIINNEFIRQNALRNINATPLKVPKGLKFLSKYGGWLFSLYGAYDIYDQKRSGRISERTMWIEQASNGIGAIPYVGTGWSVGWEAGKRWGPSTWYGNNDNKWFK